MKTVDDILLQLIEILNVEELIRARRRCKKRGFDLLSDLLSDEIEKRNERGDD